MSSVNAPAGASHLNITFGSVVLMGGLMGYIKKKSMPSLIAGSVLSSGFFGSAYMINNQNSSSTDVRNAFIIGAVSSLVLGGVMFPRFLKTKAVMPAGVCSLVAALGAAYNGQKAMEWS